MFSTPLCAGEKVSLPLSGLHGADSSLLPDGINAAGRLRAAQAANPTIMKNPG
jgi:hypothetical protein